MANKLKKISENEFINNLSDVETISFQQTKEMGDALHNLDWQEEYLALVNEKEEVLSTALILTKPMFAGKHMELNFGPMYREYDEELILDFFNQLKNYAKKEGVLELVIRPNINANIYSGEGEKLESIAEGLQKRLEANGFKRDPKNEIITWQYVKDLSSYDNYNKLFKSFTKDGQYSIKKTRQFGINVRPMTFEELPKFKEVTSQTADRRGYEDKSLDYYQEVFKAFGDKAEFLVAEINFSDYKNNLLERKAKLEADLAEIEEFLAVNANSRKKNNQKKEVLSEISTYEKRLIDADSYIEEFGQDDIILAVGLFIYNPKEVVYLFSGSDDKYKKFYAPFAVQEYVMQKAMNEDIPRYNFYGVSGVFDGSDGVLGFKKNFNGVVEEKVGDYVTSPQPLKKKSVDLVKKVLGRG